MSMAGRRLNRGYSQNLFTLLWVRTSAVGPPRGGLCRPSISALSPVSKLARKFHQFTAATTLHKAVCLPLNYFGNLREHFTPALCVSRLFDFGGGVVDHVKVVFKALTV